MTDGLGRILVVTGIVMTIAGVIILFRDSIPFLKIMGKLPGDIAVEKENFRFYFPVTTSIIISIILTLIFYIAGKFR